MNQIISLEQTGGNRGSTVAQIVDVKGLRDWSVQPFIVEIGEWKAEKELTGSR